MSDFNDLLAEGFAAVRDQSTTAAGAAVEVEFNGIAKPCVPATSPRSKELRDSGVWEAGMVMVEMLRTDVAAMGLTIGGNDRAAVNYGPPSARRAMKVYVFDDDPADPCLRLTLQPDRSSV